MSRYVLIYIYIYICIYHDYTRKSLWQNPITNRTNTNIYNIYIYIYIYIYIKLHMWLIG